MADGHDAWYRRELDRGRRFHGAFAGGFSAGYHNTVGSAEGWQPASFRSSRTKRQRVAGARPEEIGDAEDGLLGRTVAVGAGYGSRAGDAAGPATAGAPPLGLIFAAFMVSYMAGSTSVSIVTRDAKSGRTAATLLVVLASTALTLLPEPRSMAMSEVCLVSSCSRVPISSTVAFFCAGPIR